MQDASLVDICMIVMLGVVDHNYERLAKVVQSSCLTEKLPLRPLDSTVKLWVTKHPDGWMDRPGQVSIVAADERAPQSIDLDTNLDLVVCADRRWLDHPKQIVVDLDRLLSRIGHPREV